MTTIPILINNITIFIIINNIIFIIISCIIAVIIIGIIAVFYVMGISPSPLCGRKLAFIPVCSSLACDESRLVGAGDVNSNQSH